MDDIFISYSRTDRDKARRIAEILEGRGWSVWWDREILPGKIFDEVIENKLAEAACAIVLWSRESVSSSWVKTEAAEAARRRVLVPAIIEGTTLPLEFRRIQTADLTTWDGREDHEGLGDLIQAVSATLAGSGPAREASKEKPLPPAPPGHPPNRSLRLFAFGVLGLLTVAVAVYLFMGPRGAKPPIVPESETPPRARAPLADVGRIVVITDQQAVFRPLAAHLGDLGAEVVQLGTTQIGTLQTRRPGLVLVGWDTTDYWETQSRGFLNAIFETPKVIAFGDSAVSLYQQLNLELTAVMHTPDKEATVELPDLLRSPLPIDSTGNVIQVSLSERLSPALHDRGSPAVAGFEGIARAGDRVNYWRIARQGNFVLWGFDGFDTLTNEGKSLFVNLLVNHRSQLDVPLSKARKGIEHVQPGEFSDVLTQQFHGHDRPFQVVQPGKIRAQVEWQPTDVPLALILNGPGQTGYYIRKDGASPLALEFDVTPELVAKGTTWRIRVTTFRNLGESRVRYTLRLSVAGA